MYMKMNFNKIVINFIIVNLISIVHIFNIGIPFLELFVFVESCN